MTDALFFSLTGAEAEGSDIPAAVPMENLTPETQEATGGAPEPMEVAAREAAATTGGEEATTLPEPALEVVVRSPEIQDAEPIRSAPGFFLPFAGFIPPGSGNGRNRLYRGIPLNTVRIQISNQNR
jgi:hypothetical protein